MKWMNFNVNQQVKVKLTEYGRRCHYKHHLKLTKLAGCEYLEYLEPDEDEHGWSSWQFWKLCEIFGEYMGVEQKDVFESNILIYLPEFNEIPLPHTASNSSDYTEPS